MTKEKSCLVTQSLIGSVDWYLTAPNTIIKPEKGGDGKTTWKEKAMDDLTGMLNRIKRPFPEAAKRGVNFEKAVYQMANKDITSGSVHFQEVCKLVKGFKFYTKGGMNIDIAGNDCYLYAKYDAIILPEVILPKIIDIKTTANYKKDKYLAGFQHKLYCRISGADNFEYVIAEWDKDENGECAYPKIKKVHRELFIVEDRELLESEVSSIIAECFDTLKDLNLWDAYRTNYCLY